MLKIVCIALITEQVTCSLCLTIELGVKDALLVFYLFWRGEGK